jgi:hypothetical protein
MQVRCPFCTNVFTSDVVGAQRCPSCGQSIDVPAPPVAAAPAGTGLSPSAGGGPPAPSAQGVAWEERAKKGAFAAFWDTWKNATIRPTEFWDGARGEGGRLWDAVSFAWIALAAYSALSGLMGRLRLESQTEQLERVLGNVPEEYRGFLETAMAGPTSLGAILGGLLLIPLGFLALVGITHVSCIVCGCASRGFTATARAFAYGSAPYLLGWVPCLGLFAMLYGAILQVWGLWKLQNTTKWRAALAVSLPSLVVCCCIGGTAVWVFSKFKGEG